MSDYGFTEFMDIIRKLRSEEGCPWDREQTHSSLKSCLMEECYETIEAIENQDSENLCEELGDLLLQIALHSVIAEENKEFTISEVISGEGEKMIRRHPHVFGSGSAKTSEEVLDNWDNIKAKEKSEMDLAAELQSIPKAFPAILRAQKVLKKTLKTGVPPIELDTAIQLVTEGLEGLKNKAKSGDVSLINEIFGDLLFSIVNISLILQLNAENSLTNATNKFINRFVDIITLTDRNGRNLCDISPAEQGAMWGSKKI